MQEAEAADLIAQKAAVGRVKEVHSWGAEHAGLRVLVAQVRDLYDLGFVLEARVAARAEEALRRIQHVAAVTGERLLKNARDNDAVGGPRAGEEIPSALLWRRQRVVEATHRVGRREDLQLEVREPLHLRGRRQIGTPYQAVECDDEIVE